MGSICSDKYDYTPSLCHIAIPHSHRNLVRYTYDVDWGGKEVYKGRKDRVEGRKGGIT